MPTYWYLFFALALVAIGAGLAVWRVQRRRKRRKPIVRVPPKLTYPVVLAHGILGFDELKVGPLRNAYFRGVEPRLTKLGAKVYAFKVRPSSSVAARAEDLRRAVEALDAGKVNIIAHSMGGLDARYAAARLGLGNKVASIITVGTPHRGTPLADLGTNFGVLTPAARKLLEAMRLDVEGFFDLTSARMLAFNEDVKDVKGVWYGSWTAHATGKMSGMNPLLIPTWKVLYERAGQNDGLVPAESQRWGEVCGAIEADHWAQIGWSRNFDAPAFYEELVRDLIRRGL